MQTIILEVQDKGKTILLLESALQKQGTQIALGIGKTRKRLGEFEQRYGCRLEEVDRIAPQIDPLDRVEWEGEAEMLQRLETEQTILKAVRVCA